MAENKSPSRAKGANGTHAHCIAFVADDQSLAVFNNLKAAEDTKQPHAIKGTIKDAIAYLGKKATPSIIMVDVSHSELPVSDLLLLAEVCPPDISVFAIGDRNDVGLYRDLKGLGVIDYLVKPLTPEIIYKSLDLLGPKKKDIGLSKVGKLVGFWGARGGVGTTSILTNMAWILAEEKSKKVAIADTNFYTGTTSLHLNVPTQSGLKDILENAGNVDETLFDRLAVPVTQKLHIYSMEESFFDYVKATIQGWSHLTDFLQKRYFYTFVDLGNALSPIHAHLISQLNTLFVIVDPSLASVRDVNRLMQYLRQSETPLSVHIILNKAGLYKEGELTTQQFADAISLPVDHVIPFDESYLDAINRGHTLSDKKSGALAEMRHMTQALIGLSIGGGDATQGQQSWFAKTLKRLCGGS